MERLLPICALLAACAATPVKTYDVLVIGGGTATPVDEAPATAAPAGAVAMFDLLDGDGDGVLSAFEALDVLLVLSEEGESLTRDGLEARLAEAAGDVNSYCSVDIDFFHDCFLYLLYGNKCC